MENKIKKIILTGYRATGKTIVGKLLAGQLGFTFLDTDHEIESRYGAPISQIVASHGWDYFRKLENNLLETLVDHENMVISTGGGAIMHQAAWHQLRKNSFVIWLTADIATICRRLASHSATASQRPSLTGRDIFTEVESVLLERQPLYEKGSDITIQSEQPLPDVLEEIKKAWQQNQNT
ncbi:MAG: shikimate kinase [Desulfobulbaceae bacterium]|uniref:Shikimate kinase n=1 Tax=Candidatus Desulfobia pelagia TaxID=2841692 RepID=A0A8J6NEN5_9BACT|nr:shikimate kinase [Candidatus Desulfobia pelagia]